MKRWIQSIIAVAIVCTMTTTSFAAALFSDVSASHWASASINTVANENIMPGYSDASFKPLEKTTKIETVLVSYRLLKETGKLGTFNASASVKANAAQLTAAKIPSIIAPYGSEVYTAFSFMLDNKLIAKEELSGYVSAGKPVQATKEQVAVMLGKTLNFVKKESLTGKIISFGYVDSSEISSAAAPYLNLLIENNLLSATGDANKKLNPKVVMNRETTAFMVAGVYKALSATAGTSAGSTAGSTTGTTGTTTGTATGTGITGTSTVSGTITAVYTEKLSIQVKDSLGLTNAFVLSGTEMIKNNAPIGFFSLVVGDNVILNVSNGKVTKIIVEKNYSKVTGTYVEISKDVVDATTGKKFRVITIKKSDDKLDYYKVETGLHVEIDRVVKQVENLVKGDKLTISYDGYYARKIEAYSAKSEVLITLTKFTDLKAGSVLNYKLPDGRAAELIFTAAPEIVKLGGKDLKKGDIVKGTFVYGVLMKLEATGLVSEDTGKIKEILISDTTSKLTILNTAGERKIYSFQSKAVLNINNDKMNIDGLYQLRMGQDVFLEMDALGIYQLTLNKVVEQSKMTMTLMEVVTGSLLKATDEEGKVWVINLKDGFTGNVSEFKPGDKIIFSGTKLSEFIFEATGLE